MKKRMLFFFGSILILATMVVCLGTCLDPVNFTPQNPIPVVISGSIDTWLKENAVLWVINKSKTVDITKLEIFRSDEDDAYPITYPPGGIYGAGAAIPHGTSLASYHKPATLNPIPWYRIEISYPTANITFPDDKPGWWDNSYAIDYGTYPPGPIHTIKIKKQMPRGMDYVILFYKTNDGVMVVDEDTEKHVSNPGDTINNNLIVLPSNGNEIIVTGIIDAIISGQVSVTGIDSGLEGIVSEIRIASQNAINSMGEMATVISNAFDKHAQTLLDAYLNHKIEIVNNVNNTVNVDTGMETLLEYLRERYDQKTAEKSVTIYNASASVIVDSINITQGNLRESTNGNKINGGDSYNIYLQTPDRNFDIVIQYHYIGSSDTHYRTNKIAIIGNEYVVFYKQIGDNFTINKTADMRALMESADKNDFIVNNDPNSVKINILNNSSAMRIVGLTLRKYKAEPDDPLYCKEDVDFVSRGPIGAAGGNDSIIFTSLDAMIESGKSYTLDIIGEDYRDTVGKGYIVIEVQRPLYIGGAVTLIVTEQMVQNAIQKNKPAITYKVRSNGGLGDPRDAATYDTTMLTFTFDNPPQVTPTFEYVSGVTTGPLVKTADPLVYTASCTTTVDKDILVICTNEQASNVTSAAQGVKVYKSRQSQGVITTTKYVYNDAYVTNKTVPRNTYHQLEWELLYDIVVYKDGVEDSRTTVTKKNYGEWLIDSSNNGGYITFTKDGLLRIGPRPSSGFISGNDKVGVTQWDFYGSVVFGQYVDGHLIENMVSERIPLFLGPFQIGYKTVYGLQVTLKIVN